jgi:CubicO group peptidase (beta-lactamase class C family)
MATHAGAAAAGILKAAIANRVFPAAVAEVGDRERALWRDAAGTLTFEADAPAATPTTIFDLASLTKPLATTSLTLQFVAARAVDLTDPVAMFFEEWRGPDREPATIRDLLEHASGLAARLVDQPPATRREFEHEICTMKLAYQPRQRSVYSDLGFMLLGFLVADRGGSSLDSLFAALAQRAAGLTSGGNDPDADVLQFGVSGTRRDRTAPTMPLDEDVRRGRWLAGDVHDNYAAALGGVAGHSGLFGTAAAVGRFARTLLRGALGDRTLPAPFAAPFVAEMIRKSRVPGSSRALGWDTALPTSSCGTRMSPAAFGHVGFTGTSLWIDPVLDRYFVLLTNRACGGGTLAEMRDVRRAFHDVATEIE